MFCEENKWMINIVGAGRRRRSEEVGEINRFLLKLEEHLAFIHTYIHTFIHSYILHTYILHTYMLDLHTVQAGHATTSLEPPPYYDHLLPGTAPTSRITKCGISSIF
jgi:hypothetical protein